jgi:hypothetical protein
MNGINRAMRGVWSTAPHAAVVRHRGAGTPWRVPYFANGVLIGGIVVLLVWLLL